MAALRQSYRQRMWNEELDERERRAKRKMAEQTEPTMTISVSRSIGLRGFHNKVEAFVSISGLTKDTTPEQFQALLESQKVNWATMTKALNEKIEADAALLGGPAPVEDHTKGRF